MCSYKRSLIDRREHKMQKKLLLEQIRQKRENMLKTAAYSGFNSQQTLERSQELDRLIIKYQRLNKDNY